MTPPANNINLEQIAGLGTGTSQIGPGDLVEITIVSGSGEERPMPMPARVTPDGKVLVPIVGAVTIGGLEPAGAEQRIAETAIERGVFRQPYVTVTVKEPAVNRVSVLGAVAKPGTVSLPRGTSDLASALAAAGGLTKEASMRVEILHQGGPPFGLAQEPNATSTGNKEITLASYADGQNPPGGPFGPPRPLDQPAYGPNGFASGQSAPTKTLIDLAQSGAAGTQNRKLQDRDVVMVVPEQTPVIHVTGLVARPNQFELTRGKDIRVLDAIAMAGGTTLPVADKVFVIRQLPEMPQPAVIKVSISRAKRYGNENLRLAAGDLVSVESTPATMVADALTKFVRVAFGVSGSVATF